MWLDAHGDLQTCETTSSGYIGGFPLRILAGYRPELISTRIGLTAVPQERITLVDARDLDPPEREFLATSPIRHVTVDRLTGEDLPDGPLYLHIDLDVVDPDDLPGQLFPAPGGPRIADVAAAVALIAGTERVAAVGIGCTWHPGRQAASRVRDILAGLA